MDGQPVLNAFVRQYLADLESGRPRSLEEYQALFAGNEAEISLSYRIVSAGGDGEDADASRDGDGRSTDAGLRRGPFGRFELKGVLGRGGMGVVYLATMPGGRQVALKLQREGLGAAVHQRFEREMRIALRIRHPNVVGAIEAGIAEGRCYLATEVMWGGSLARLLRHHGRLPEPAALRILRDVVAGLSVLHGQGVVHRDLKPSNVLFDSGGVAKIADLCLARSTAPGATMLTLAGAFLGTPQYMAPEVIRDGGGAADIRADLYAAGVLLYACLAGEVPFQDDARVDVLRKHLEAPVPDLRESAPGVSRATAGLVCALLQKDPARRPRDPAEALGHLDHLLSRRSTADSPSVAAILSPLPPIDVEPCGIPSTLSTLRLHAAGV